MTTDGIEYVFAVYAVVLGTLVLWLWMMSRRIAIIERRQQRLTSEHAPRT